MNLFELFIFVLVTGSLGALVGGIAGLFGAGFLRGAQTGGFAGPIIAAGFLVIYSIATRRKKNNQKERQG